MEVWTEEPGVQFYSGNFVPADLLGKTGAPYGPRHGFCLETQHYPDSPNHPDFPAIVLRPGSIYRTRTVHRFSVL
jgi:aldose 1-epimerase